MQYISLKKAIKQQQQGQGIIIDVREPTEFREGHLPKAINLPSTQFKIEDYKPWVASRVYLICQSGDRARTISTKLKEKGYQDTFVLRNHMEYINQEQTSSIWSVDRQFRFFLGFLIAVFLMGYNIISEKFIIIPIILCLGLIITAIIDKCYLRVGISMMPWNTKVKQ